MAEEEVVKVKAKDVELGKVYKTQKNALVLIHKKEDAEKNVKASTTQGVPINIPFDYELEGPIKEHPAFTPLATEPAKKKVSSKGKTEKKPPKDNAEIDKQYEEASTIVKAKYPHKENKGYIGFTKDNLKLRIVKETNRVVIWSPKQELKGCKISRQGKYGWVYDLIDAENVAYLKG